MLRFTIGSVILALIAAIITSAPVEQGTDKSMPYEYEYKVEDANRSVYFGAQERGDAAGRVEGSYYVWLPNGRLMKVTYFIEGESGFVPKITFEDNASPIGTVPKS